MNVLVDAIVGRWDYEGLRDLLAKEASALTIRQNLARVGPLLDGTLAHPANSLGIAMLLHAVQQQEQRGGPALDLPACAELFTRGDHGQMRLVDGHVCALVRAYIAGMTRAGTLLQALPAVKAAVEALRPSPNHLTSIHADFVRACVCARAHQFALPLVRTDIFDLALCGPRTATVQHFLLYFYYAALCLLVVEDYEGALRQLLVVLTVPGTVLSAIQADAYKKYALASLVAHGHVQALPKYTGQSVTRFSGAAGYVDSIVEAFEKEDAGALAASIQEHTDALNEDRNLGLAQRAQAALPRHRLGKLTKTYLTLSLPDIAAKVGISVEELEPLLVDMAVKGALSARIDASRAMVRFDSAPVAPAADLQGRLTELLATAQRVADMEQEAQYALARHEGKVDLELDSGPNTPK